MKNEPKHPSECRAWNLWSWIRNYSKRLRRWHRHQERKTEQRRRKYEAAQLVPSEVLENLSPGELAQLVMMYPNHHRTGSSPELDQLVRRKCVRWLSLGTRTRWYQLTDLGRAVVELHREQLAGHTSVPPVLDPADFDELSDEYEETNNDRPN